MKKHKNLTFTQRLQIKTLYNAKKTKKEIAQILGLHLCTIYRELKRCAYEHTTKQDTFWYGVRIKKQIRYFAQRPQDR
jgi:IS30 family transposase